MYDFGSQFYIDMTKSKTPSSYVFMGKTYRISILSDALIRFEYSETGAFNDYPTFFATNRSFGKPKITIEEDNNVLVIKSSKFIIEYIKEKPYIGSKFLPDQYLKVSIVGTDKVWYFNHPEVRNFKGSTYSLDDYKGGGVSLDKGLFSLDGFTTFDDSRTPILNQYGNIIAPNYKNIDTYLFIYNNDFGVGLRDYFNLTGLPPLIPRYALGVWWNKNEAYNSNEIEKIVYNFKKNDIPLSVILLGEYERTKNKSISMSQILYRDYSKEEAILIVKEMNDMLSNKLRRMNKTTKLIYLGINYSRDLCKKFKETILLNESEDIPERIYEVLEYIYYKNIENLPIRKITIAYSKLSNKKYIQLSLFENNIIETDKYHKAIDKINERFGQTSILRASSLLKNSTIKNREKFKNII